MRPGTVSGPFVFVGGVGKIVFIPLIYQDDDVVVVNKPAGVNVHSDEGAGLGFDMVSALKRQLGVDYLGLHHRLDREVSGVIVLALRAEANARLAKLFEGREAQKEYLALVKGRPPKKSGVIDAPLAPRPDGRWQVVTAETKGAKSASTRYRLEGQGPGYSLLRLTLETGRTHQLRVHLAHVGCPIIGDVLYGAPPAKGKGRGKSQEEPKFPRLLLHAVRLGLPGIGVGWFEAPLPAIFERAKAERPLPELALAERLSGGSVSLLQPGERVALNGLLELARERRAPLADDPLLENTAYRLVNAVGDGLPGMTLDRYGSALVLNCYDPVLETGHPALKLLLDGITRIWPGISVYAKFRPRQTSQLGENVLPEVAPPKPLAGPGENLPEVLTVQENGLNYLIRPGEGLSVGLFLDMREVRARLREWAADKTILNCFSYTCAFGVSGLAGAAKRVLNLDAGRRALEWGKENYQANGLTINDFDFVDGDMFDWLGRFARREELFEVVILDPPSYSTTRKTRWAAEQDYDKLAALAAKIIAPGGLLLACSNHAGLNRKNFRQMVLKGIEEANRQGEIIGVYHEPELDFPRSGETEGYLKVLALRLD